MQKNTNKHFYQHIVEFTSVESALDELSLTDAEKRELLELADLHIHHTVLDLVLSELSEEDKVLFLSHHAAQNHTELWKLLNSKVSGIEEKIRQAVKDVHEKLHKDIKNVKRKKTV